MERTKLIQARTRKHWTQKEAAGHLGVSVRAYSEWERGEAMPRASSMQLLCDTFRLTSEELDFDVKSDSSVAYSHKNISAFITCDLSSCLLTLAFTAPQAYGEVQAKVSSILEEFDAMNIDPMTRREALKRLAALSVMSFPASLFDVRQSPEATLTQCAASIAACQELGRGKEASDLALAFEGAAAAIQRLLPLIRDSSRHRKASVILAAQAARLQQVLAGHLESPEAAIRHAQQAVLYGKESGDIQEYLMTLEALAWSYEAAPRYSKQALQTMEQAAVILQEQRTQVPLYIHGQIYSTLAVMQAKNGQSSDTALRLAEKNAFVDQRYALFIDDPTYTLTINEAEVFSHHGNYNNALDALSQIVDSTTFSPKRSFSERGYIRTLSNMTLVSLKTKTKDLERSTHLWRVTMQRAKTLKSERRFDEMMFAYHLMDTLWGDDTRVKELRPLTTHW
jgi:transcriptional regulator with XRE-family HTH domain